jgi:hypothetical protein
MDAISSFISTVIQEMNDISFALLVIEKNSDISFHFDYHQKKEIHFNFNGMFSVAF